MVSWHCALLFFLALDAPLSAALIAELQAEVDPLRPEARIVELEGRAGHADQTDGQPLEGRILGGVDGSIDLVARMNDVADVEKRIADENACPVRGLEAEVDVRFGDDRELVAPVMVMATVARLG